MSRITETFTIQVEGRNVSILNDGTKKFENQAPQALKDLSAVVLSHVKAGKTSGFIPYNNFESSVTWKIIVPNQTPKETKP